MPRIQLFFLICLIDSPQVSTKCSFGSQRKYIDIFSFKHTIQIFGELENISVGEQFTESQSTVLLEPEHFSPRARARFSEGQSTVLREPDHGSPRARPEHSSPKTSPRSPCAPNLLHVLLSRTTGYHNLCSPVNNGKKLQDWYFGSSLILLIIFIFPHYDQ